MSPHLKPFPPGILRLEYGSLSYLFSRLYLTIHPLTASKPECVCRNLPPDLQEMLYQMSFRPFKLNLPRTELLPFLNILLVFCLL